MKKYGERIFPILAIIFALLSSIFKDQVNVHGVNVLLTMGILCLFLSLLCKYLGRRSLPTNPTSKSVNIYYFVLTIALIAYITYSIITTPDTNDLEASRKIAMPLTASLIILLGLKANKIKMNKYFGLRLPWLYTSEERWNAAHQCLRDISIPIAILYMILANLCPINYFASVSIITLLLWLTIASVYPLIKRIP